MYRQLIEDIKVADMVLVGIGREVSIDYDINVFEDNDFSAWKDIYIRAHRDDKNIIDFYNNLSNILEHKNYFVITTNIDGIIDRSNLNKIRIVSPCGSIDRIQCNCEDELGILDVPDGFYDDANNKNARCSQCKAYIKPNIYNRDFYNEKAYLKQWNLYNKWLSGTLNKKLLILEIGSDFSMISVYRLPFEKMALINNNAKYYRISNNYPNITSELKDKMYGIKDDVYECITKLSKLFIE